MLSLLKQMIKLSIHLLLIGLLCTCKHTQKIPTLNPYEKQLLGTWQYDFGNITFSQEDQKLYNHIFITYKADKTYLYTDIKDTIQGNWEIKKEEIYLYLYKMNINGKKSCYKFHNPIKDKLILLLCSGKGNQKWKRVNQMK